MQLIKADNISIKLIVSKLFEVQEMFVQRAKYTKQTAKNKAERIQINKQL